MQQTHVRTTELGTTGLRITRVGFGAWAIGGGGWEFGWGPQHDGESIAAIERALELGVNWIDTAAAYGFGRSEEVVGRALAGLTERPYVFTKASLVEGPGRRVVHNLKRDSILREVSGSLERLGVEAIDLYQVHWPNPEHDLEEGWSTFAELKEQGLVRHIGVSNFDPAQLARVQQIAPVETLQPPYSLVERGIEREILPYAERHGIGVIVYSPMGSGLLSGRMTRERVERLPADDWRKHDARFREPQLSAHLALVGRLADVAERHGSTAGAVAVAWTLRNAAVDGAIVGFRRPDQVEPIIEAAGLELTAADVAEIEDAAGEVGGMTTIGFVGLGTMGGRIAGRLLASGHPLVGWNRTKLKAEPLLERGLVWCDTPREVAESAEVVFSMVTDDPALDAIAAGPDGVLGGLAAGKIWVEMSTVSPGVSAALAEQARALGAAMLDAPVSGSVREAVSGTLTIMVGGDGQAFAAAEPLLHELGSAVRHVGVNGQGLVLKLAVNVSLAAQMLAFSEGVLLAERGGIARELAVEVMAGSSIGSPFLRGRAPLLVDLPDEAWFDVELAHKDIRLALATASSEHVSLPSAALADEWFTKATSSGYGHRDVASLLTVLAETSPARPEA